MAEYIERDIAIRTAIEMCAKVVGHGITQFDAAEIAIAFEDIPTADVVPKSEVDWNSIPVDVSEALEQRAVEKAKSEVAREIFEAIEKCMTHDYISSIGVYNGALAVRIAELKKKYTGEEICTSYTKE